MTDLAKQITAIELTLASLDADDPLRGGLEARLAKLRVQLGADVAHSEPTPLLQQSGGVNLGSAQVERIDKIVGQDDVVGDKVLGNKIVQQFFDGQPGEDGARLLHDYLVALLDANRTLRLSRMTERRQSGGGQSLLPPLRLADVFTNLTTNAQPVIVETVTGTVVEMRALIRRIGLDGLGPESVPSEQARTIQIEFANRMHNPAAPGRTLLARSLAAFEESIARDVAPDEQLYATVLRPELALEAVAISSRLVLLGAPGSGKSTALRYLALLLAEHLLDPERAPLPIGWDTAPVPILCPLGVVASALARTKTDQSDEQVLWQVLAAQLDGEGNLRQGLGRYLRPSLRNGAALLLLDGLDELPATPGPDGQSMRTRVSRAVQALARGLPRSTRVAITCRVLPYEQTPATVRDDWRLPADDGWAVRRLQPLAFGQVRQFVTSWYDSACEMPGAIYHPDEGQARVASLIEQLEASDRLRALTASPLLLTMLAILHYNKETGELPRDRARLYGRVRAAVVGALGAGAYP